MFSGLTRYWSLGTSAGLLSGLVVGSLFSIAIHPLFASFPTVTPFAIATSLLVLAVLGIHIGRTVEARFLSTLLAPSPVPAIPPSSSCTAKLLDTSAIIDGRIADLCATGFLEGPFLLSQSVLRELHLLADSAQAWKRARGKRGLAVLQHLHRIDGLELRTIDDVDPELPDVDAKLIARAKAHQAKLITNDWNLNQVATVQGITVLNVNELCHRLQPGILPGDTIRVYLFKEGQAREQAIAHLDDGTMVVVEQAKAYIGMNVDVTVTGIHQTQSGRMLFGTLRTNGQSHGEPAPRAAAMSSASTEPTGIPPA
ncbi:MAG: PIN domain nuclease [Nitrospirae bacterium]|nr:MAG: PIN domain nuclease [Nitrospirota bacterium]